MPQFIKNHTYHVILIGKNSGELNKQVHAWTLNNTEAVIQHMALFPFEEGLEAHIFYSDYPPEVKGK